MRNLMAGFLLIAGQAVAQDATRFSPVDVPAHTYDGGWDHFVGGGLAVFDCNADARPDMVAAGGANPMILLRNTTSPGGAISFASDTPDSLALIGTTGAYPLDIDNDGTLALVVLRVGPDVVLRGLPVRTHAPCIR